MAELSGIPQLPAFIPDADITSAAMRWKRWLDRFENLIIALNVTDNARKKALLLHMAGEAVYEIYDGLVVAAVAQDADPEVDNVYLNTKQALDNHFNPKRNAEFEIFNFRKAQQQQDETVDAYHARLRSLARYCEFVNTDAEIKSHIIQTCSSSRLRRRTLSEPALTLQQLLDIARSMEAAERQVQCIEGNKQSNNISDTTVAAIRQPQNTGRQQNRPSSFVNTGRQSAPQAPQSTCRNCGGPFPHPGGRSNCAGYGKRCNLCLRLNHLARCCLSSNQQLRSPYDERSTPGSLRPPPQTTWRNQVSQVDQHVDEGEPRSGYAYRVDRKQPPASPPKQPYAHVFVDGNPIRFIVDSGATVNIVDDVTLSAMRPTPTLRAARSKIYAYGSQSPMNIRGTFHAMFESKQKVTDGEIYVVSGRSGSLLSFKTASELGLIKLNINAVEQRTDNITVEQLGKEFPGLFKGIGKLKNHQVKLHIDPTVKPVAQQHRRVPFHLQKMVEAEIQIMLDEDIIEKADGPTPWMSPIVTPIKPNDPTKVRVCTDMRLVNEAIVRERHVTPTMDDIIHDLNGAKYFSKLDMTNAFNQLELAPESRYITCFSTHVGLFRYKRLSFGLNCSSEIFQATLSQILSGIPGVKNVCDDIIVYGATQAEHNKSLMATVKRLHESGLTLNRKKLELNKRELEFYGSIFGENGVRVSPSKIEAVNKMDRPQNASEVRSLLGMTGYCSRVIPDYATLTEPLRRIAKQDCPFNWTQTEQTAFNDLRAALSKDITTAYFSPQRHTSVVVDASPVGLAAALVQPDERNVQRVITFVARALTDVETRYSQTEREALACVWACERLHRYIYGSKFDLITDHKPLEFLYGNPKSKMPARIERWRLRLQPYDFRVQHQRGDLNMSDYLSRHPVNAVNEQETSLQKDAEEYICFMIDQTVPKTMTREQITAATKADSTLQKLIECIRTGDWREARTDSDLKPYFLLRNELSTSDAGDAVLRGTRIVMPKALQSQAINLAHQGHQGIVRTKSLLRQKVWFTGIDKQTEEIIAKCIACQATTQDRHSHEPLMMSALPTAEWTELSLDFLGPLPTGEYLLVLHDDYSRFPVVEIINSTSAKTVIPVLDRVFALLGIPEVLRTDNGPPMNSHEFAQFADYLGFKHRRIIPLAPQSNGQVERMNQSLEKVLRTAKIEGKNWKQELYTFLRAYRNTPHPSTNRTPSELLLHRSVKTRMPDLSLQCPDTPLTDYDVRERDTAAKAAMKSYADRRRNASHKMLQIGDAVLLKVPKIDKLSSYYDPRPYIITAVKGTMITARRGERSVTRNSSFFKPIVQQLGQPIITHSGQSMDLSDGEDDIIQLDQHQPANVAAPQQQPPQQPAAPPARNAAAAPLARTRPQRQKQLPVKLTDYIMT